MSSSSTPAFFCRWDTCPRTFTTLPDLRSHFVHDHIPVEVAEYVPAHKRRRRDDGGWEIIESVNSHSHSHSHAHVLHGHNHAHAHVHGHGHGMQLLSDMTTLSSIEPSFAVPSLPGSFTYSQSMEVDPHEQPGVDYDAFLRSPSPGPVQSTPVSQVPPPSQDNPPSQSQPAAQVGIAIPTAQIQQIQAPTTAADTTSSSAGNTSASSAALVSPARGTFMTQAIPPPTTPSTSQKSNMSTDSATMTIAFGAASSGVNKTPGRKVSVSGFSWGLGGQ